MPKAKVKHTRIRVRRSRREIAEISAGATGGDFKAIP